MLIDAWDTDMVAVRTLVPAQHALLFGDGCQGFPDAELRGIRVTDDELDRWRNGRLANGPVDVAIGRERFRIASLPPDREVTVTWREDIATFVGEPHLTLFKGLRRYARDEELRILSMRG